MSLPFPDGSGMSCPRRNGEPFLKPSRNYLGGDSMPRQILNLRELEARARAEGFPVSGYTIRRAVRSGALPCRIVGRTYLVAWANFLSWVTCADGADNGPKVEPTGAIRRVV